MLSIRIFNVDVSSEDWGEYAGSAGRLSATAVASLHAGYTELKEIIIIMPGQLVQSCHLQTMHNTRTLTSDGHVAMGSLIKGWEWVRRRDEFSLILSI